MKSAYIHTDQVHNYNAAQEILPFLLQRFSPKSILDVGCGTGTWLKVASDLGIKDIQGLDGEYVAVNTLKIPPSLFKGHDLCFPFDLCKKYDLVLSLEVAEHLPEAVADTFINSLCKHGDIIVFSAAIPNQGGQNHINEQWPTYWIEKFMNNRYQVYDLLRFRFWDNPNVNFWYKQNMFVFVKNETRVQELENVLHNQQPAPFHLVHPQLVEHLANQIKYLESTVIEQSRPIGIKNAFRSLIREITSRFS